MSDLFTPLLTFLAWAIPAELCLFAFLVVMPATIIFVKNGWSGIGGFFYTLNVLAMVATVITGTSFIVGLLQVLQSII